MSRRLSRFAITGVLSLTVLAASGFGISHGTGLARGLSAPRARTHSRALTNVNFILNWIPNVEFAGLWVAQKFGWWKAAGINMTYKPYSLSVHPETDVPAQGGTTFGFQSGAAIAIARSQGVPIKAVYTDTQRSVFGLTVLAKSKIYNIHQLRGKRIGYQPHELYVPSTMLAYAGLKPTDWTPVVVGYTTDQLTAGQVDAYLTFLNNEPITLKLHGVPTRSFAAASYGFHAYDDVLFTTDTLINTDPSLVRRVVGVVARGFAWAHTHHLKATNITINGPFRQPAGAKQRFNRRQQLLEIKAFDRFSRDSYGRFSGRMNNATWQATVNTLFKYHEIHSKPAVSSLYTDQFNPNRF